MVTPAPAITASAPAGLALNIDNLSHGFALDGQHLPVLKRVSLQVAPGEFVALLGPSGCGKSTLLRLVAGLEPADSGTLLADGVPITGPDPSRVVVFQDPTLYPWRRVWDNVALGLQAQGILKTHFAKVDVALEKVGLSQFARAYPRQLSGGMAQRVALARALVNEPRLLILDEPTAGVDIEIRRSMWEFLRNINEQGTTIILTTHYLEEAENLCRHVAIIEGGNIIERDSMTNVLRKLQTEVFVFNLRDARSVAPRLEGFTAVLSGDHTLEIEMSKTQSLNDIFAQLSAQGIAVNSMRNKVNRLEELFIRLVDGSVKTAAAAKAS